MHRDIKPGNVLLENGVERVKITDFGRARTADDASVTQSGTVAGTPMFMSPEQANGDPVDRRSDLFSLGSVLYVMCTGRAPFRATSTMAVMKRVCDDTPTPVQQVNTDMPAWLGNIIAKLQAKMPANRYPTARRWRTCWSPAPRRSASGTRQQFERGAGDGNDAGARWLSCSAAGGLRPNGVHVCASGSRRCLPRFASCWPCAAEHASSRPGSMAPFRGRQEC